MFLLLLFVASVWAGMQNAFAGGGAFVLLPTLMLTGMDARAANITCTIALFPAQIATGWTGRQRTEGPGGVSFRTMVVISLVGGALGAVLLLVTSAQFFARLVPWLVLFATVIFAWGSFAPKPHRSTRLHRAGTLGSQLVVSIYGGYFGGGIGFLMLAAFTAAGLAIRVAAATKNVLVGAINASAVAIFVFSPQVKWGPAFIAAAGALIGGITGALLLQRVNELWLRIFVISIGTALTIGLFIKAP